MAGKAPLLLATVALLLTGACGQLVILPTYKAPAPAPFPATALKPSDLAAAMAIRDALPSLQPYLVGGNPCTWTLPAHYTPLFICSSVNESRDQAISQQDARITAFMLNGLGLPMQPSTFPLELLDQLDALNSIYITDTAFTGILPDWTSLQNLSGLTLTNNSFSGTVPNSWTSGPSVKPLLSMINLASNQFNGSLPQWGKPMSINSLNLYNNSFTGSLPVSWMTFTHLTNLNVANNQITGELPANWGLPNLFESLYYIYLSNNSLSGPLPDTWTVQSFRRPNPQSNFPPSTVLVTLDGNKQLGGPIPATFANTAISLEILPGTSLCGPVPAGVRAYDIIYGQGLKNATLPACAVNGRKMLASNS